MRKLLANLYHSRWVQYPQDRIFDLFDIQFKFRKVNTEKIKLFWARSVPNFGDELSFDTVSRMTSLPVFAANPAECNMIAIGSIYPWLKYSVKRRFNNVNIWGSGALNTSGYLKVDRGFQVHLVRGPLTAKAMHASTDVPFGDPGILANEVYEIVRNRSAKNIGLVLHMNQISSISHYELEALSKHFTIIDVRTKNAKSIVERISECSHVVSSSLHGIIVADSLGVPNARLHFDQIDPFKFLDYSEGVGRSLHCFSDLEDLMKNLKVDRNFSCLSDERTSQVKYNVVKAFPFERGRLLPIELPSH